MTLKQWRIKQGVSLNLVARAIGMDGGHLSKFERGLAQISAINAAKLVTFSKGEITFNDLFGNLIEEDAA